MFVPVLVCFYLCLCASTCACVLLPLLGPVLVPVLVLVPEKLVKLMCRCNHCLYVPVQLYLYLKLTVNAKCSDAIIKPVSYLFRDVNERVCFACFKDISNILPNFKERIK